MGEEADWIIDQLCFGPLGHEDDDDSRPPVTCRRCGSEDVELVPRDGKWTLVDDVTGKPHRCGTERLAGGFDDETV